MEDMIGIGVMGGHHHTGLVRSQIRESEEQGSIPSEAENRILARLEELDRRIGDIQEILIALDDRMARGKHDG